MTSSATKTAPEVLQEILPLLTDKQQLLVTRYLLPKGKRTPKNEMTRQLGLKARLKFEDGSVRDGLEDLKIETLNRIGWLLAAKGITDLSDISMD